MACIQLGEGNATSFSHKMLYFASSALACFPVSSCRSRRGDILEQSAHTQGSASSTASPVPSPRLAGPLQPGVPGCCLLPSLQAGSCSCLCTAGPGSEGGHQALGLISAAQHGALDGLQQILSPAQGTTSSQQSALGTQTQSCRDLWVEGGK